MKMCGFVRVSNSSKRHKSQIGRERMQRMHFTFKILSEDVLQNGKVRFITDLEEWFFFS